MIPSLPCSGQIRIITERSFASKTGFSFPQGRTTSAHVGDITGPLPLPRESLRQCARKPFREKVVENAHSPFYVEFEVFSTSGQSADPLRSLIRCHKPILEERAGVCGYLGGHRTEEVKGKVSVRCELIQMIGPFPAHYTRTITARPSRALAAPPRPRQPSPGLTAHAGNPHLAWSPGAFAPGSLGSEWQPWKGGTRPICATNFFLVSVPRGGSARPTEIDGSREPVETYGVFLVSVARGQLRLVPF